RSNARATVRSSRQSFEIGRGLQSPLRPARAATSKDTMSAADLDVAIIGAGPYGLAAAAHLHAANGLEIRVFGEPMSFWERQMPHGMMLRSPYVASNIADPEQELTLDSYGSARGKPLQRPVGLEQVVHY